MLRKPHVLVMIESSRESGRKLISGIADYARHFGPWHIHWHPQGVRGLAPPVGEKPFDGMLVRDVADVQSLVEAGIPTIAFRYRQAGAAGTVIVDADDQGIGETVARDFLDRGFKHFAFCGQRGAPWAVKRAECFEAALRQSGFAVELCWADLESEEETAEFAHGEAILRRLLSLPKPVAIMAANDDIGHWVVQLCQSGGLRVPEDCAVVGVDNDPVVCGVCDPPLSSVTVDQLQTGYRAAAVLDKMMRGEKPEQFKITAEVGALAVRQSSDILAIADGPVSKALRFMQQNAHRPLSVDEIAEASGLFRRGLERRFREQLSQSIQQRFREVRAAYLADLIGATRFSLEEIAEQCGFPQASHLSRFFTSVRGETPSAFRKRTSQADRTF